MSRGIVAIVGRPNVGKSTLFNRLLRRRQAIVEQEPGVTRDRIYATAEWRGLTFTIVDTGGLDWDDGDHIRTMTTRQAEAAIAEADVVIFLVDVTAGVTPGDEAVADVLRRTEKPLILAANKVDGPSREDEAADFHRLGLDAELVTVSAYHGLGIGDLLDAVVERLPRPERGEGPEEVAGEEDEDGPVRVTIVGRPNVGKSSLVNAILREERMIVTDTPGTTRDAVDVAFRRGDERYVLVDTAGLRRRTRIKEKVERYSVLRTLRAVDRSDVVVLVLDATRPLAEQDKKVAGYVTEAGRALVVAVNKWDLVEKDERTYLGYLETLRRGLHFAAWAPVVFTSALTGRHLGRLLGTVRAAALSHRRRIRTSEVNRVFRDAVAMAPPPGQGRRRLRVSYATQASVRPPTFVFFVNDPSLVRRDYARYLENRAREAWDFSGTPIRLLFRPKGDSSRS